MRKTFLFAIILATALSLLAAVSVWYLSLYGTANFSWTGMMGHDNGENHGGLSYGVLQYLWILLIPLVAMVIFGVIGLGYYLVYPEIRRSLPSSSSSATPPPTDTLDPLRSPLTSSPSLSVTPSPALSTFAGPNPSFSSSSASVSPVSDTLSTRNETPTDVSSSSLSWPVLIKTSKPDERKILEVLASHNGTYLQKLIGKELGLSKLQTHRIIARLEERGIVKVVESGNTNQVSLAEWLGHPDVRAEHDPQSDSTSSFSF